MNKIKFGWVCPRCNEINYYYIFSWFLWVILHIGRRRERICKTCGFDRTNLIRKRYKHKSNKRR